MAEFKITQALDAEVNALAADAQTINQSFVAANSSGIDTLSVAKAFVQEQKQLKELLTLYASLLAKDADDLTAMIAKVRETDAKIGTAY